MRGGHNSYDRITICQSGSDKTSTTNEKRFVTAVECHLVAMADCLIPN